MAKTRWLKSGPNFLENFTHIISLKNLFSGLLQNCLLIIIVTGQMCYTIDILKQAIFQLIQ